VSCLTSKIAQSDGGAALGFERVRSPTARRSSINSSHRSSIPASTSSTRIGKRLTSSHAIRVALLKCLSDQHQLCNTRTLTAWRAFHLSVMYQLITYVLASYHDCRSACRDSPSQNRDHSDPVRLSRLRVCERRVMPSRFRSDQATAGSAAVH